MLTTSIKKVLKTLLVGTSVTVQGWVNTRRMGKNVAFIMLKDGSNQTPLQIVVDPATLHPNLLTAITTGACLRIQGIIAASQGKNQGKELQASSIELLGDAPVTTYPLQSKRHTLAFLRTLQHLRFRTNTFGAIFRVRHAISYAIHQFFHKKDFFYLHTPIITSADAEGAGELFGVSSGGASATQPPFFGQPTYLTVSGQLAAETAALALGKVYTFGPTFRAENSNTTRHLSEFWMVEPEMAFYNLQDSIQLAEELIKYLITHVLMHCEEELAFLEKRALSTNTSQPTNQLPLTKQLQAVQTAPFVRITYTEAIDLLKKASAKDRRLFNFPVDTWGIDLQTEHERYLAATYFKKPVVVTDYPKEIKAFYMRQNEDDKTVAAMDILLPSIGEVIGGSQREERYDKLVEAMNHKKIAKEPMQWYLDTRRFGTAPHSGFGLGLARLVQFVTGIENIRDTIPFPRTPQHAAC